MRRRTGARCMTVPTTRATSRTPTVAPAAALLAAQIAPLVYFRTNRAKTVAASKDTVLPRAIPMPLPKHGSAAPIRHILSA